MKNRRFIYTMIISICLSVCANKNICGQNKLKHVEEFPFEIVDGGYILFECNVNDSIKGQFGFDTGGGLHVISQTLAKKANALYVKDFTGFQGHGERVDVKVYEINSLNIGKHKEINAVATPMEGLEQMGIDGILSLKLFEQQAFTLDFENKRIILETDSSLKAKIESGCRIPLRFNIMRDVTIDIFGQFVIYNDQGDSTIVELEIDTGKGYKTVLDSKYFNFFNINKDSVKRNKITYNTNKAKSFNQYHSKINKLAVCNASQIKIVNPDIVFQDSLIYDGLIGIEIWKGYKVTIDIPNRQMVIN